ncbi:MAG: AgmX/PglI C-terminal domain-containing protein [Candidatus Coatesbacteria bacterium]|nr:MAG: AgmX/PglI C-terminal domain-containing protein [Candidatus Coatesbacteria bacterium]
MRKGPNTGKNGRYTCSTEQPVVRTTIVGGRPPGPGKGVGSVPRGIEVLVKKAAVDPEFRALLLAERSSAAAEIGLELTETEAAMLDGVQEAQLETIIANTTVNPKLRPAFMGRAAAVMLAALGVGLAGCGDDGGTDTEVKGIRPDEPEVRESTESVPNNNNEKPKTDEEVKPELRKDYRTADDVIEHPKRTGGGITGISPDIPYGVITETEKPREKIYKAFEVIAPSPYEIYGTGAANELRSTAVIARVVKWHLTGIEYEYKKELKNNVELGSGEIVTEFTISPDGNVVSACIVSTTIGAPEFESAVIARIYLWLFPPIKEGEVTVIYPFEFVILNE